MDEVIKLGDLSRWKEAVAAVEREQQVTREAPPR
jgi:hypothetical protein